ncbi:uncharacterized protein N7459_003415 [Penicillium hispanicum]|uniref:uncharacterized protein n=1 Tax=Penicillium hispanicum TaxID=1080232 RepID=UPI00253FB9B9|nr:uncharacterized protein N7459_003415 [Penicillium hispanicum]KAJ5587650.1 hypothetical protein N7459_003415 [Penicillium hispanicum]
MSSATCHSSQPRDIWDRASIYTICLGGTVVSYVLRVISPGEDEEEFSRSVSSALGIQGLALLCTAIYQTFRNELTLFHDICVVHFLALLGLNLVSKGRYAGFGAWRLWCFAVIHVLSMAAFIAFNVYLWITSPHFGSQPTCNADTVYVVFGVSIIATSPVFRYITAAGFILVFSGMLPCLCGVLVSRRRRPRRGAQSHGKRGCIQYFVRTSISAKVQHHGAEKRLPRETLLNFTWSKMGYCGFCIYLIASLE